MPQMKPMSWLFLYLLFFSLIILFNMFNFFIFINKPNSKSINFKKKMSYFNWKW